MTFDELVIKWANRPDRLKDGMRITNIGTDGDGTLLVSYERENEDRHGYGDCYPDEDMGSLLRAIFEGVSKE